MSLKKIFFVPCFIITLILMGSPLHPADKSEIKVLIASQKSTFKESIINNLTQQLGEGKFFIEQIAVSKLSKIDRAEWDAIIILQAVKMGKINAHVKKYLDNSPSLNKTILITTYGSGVPEIGDYDIDAITCASQMDETLSLTGTIINQLGLTLQTQP